MSAAQLRMCPNSYIFELGLRACQVAEILQYMC